jgi:phenylpropionate dioxygenase-like ring-hydroxylating dioxygenase large terminal subunit
MLTVEDNETLCRVGPGTEMGELFRRFWIPAAMSAELPERDGTPLRVRLLGEDLVCFRDTEGRIGLLEERCPHRRTSLALGANERCGLRCLYHGWKFDVEGNCVDTPGEPPNSTLKERVKAVAYPTIERGGMIWAYMGPPEDRPRFPEYEFLNMPEGHFMVSKVQEECNYAQGLEGTIDTVHAGALHRTVRWHDEGKLAHEQVLYADVDVEHTNYGFRYAGLRKLPDGSTHTRVTIVPFPFFTFIPSPGAMRGRRLVNAWVPRDDTSTWHTQWFFNREEPVDVEFRKKESGVLFNPDFTKKIGYDEWYGQDRAAMKTTNFSGITGVVMQDHAVVETMGPISDRENEHLGQSDIAIVTWRRMLIKAARNLARTGELPEILTNSSIDFSAIKSYEEIIPPGRDWKNDLQLEEMFAPAE